MGSFQNLDIQLVYLHTYSLTPKLVFFKANLHSNFEIQQMIVERDLCQPNNLAVNRTN